MPIAIWMYAKKTTTSHELKVGKEIVNLTNFVKQLDYKAGFYKLNAKNQYKEGPATLTRKIDIPTPPGSPLYAAIPNLRTATPLLMKKAFVKGSTKTGSLGNFEKADFIFRNPAIPQLRSTYSSVQSVLNAIDKLAISDEQKRQLKPALGKMLNNAIIEL